MSGDRVSCDLPAGGICPRTGSLRSWRKGTGRDSERGLDLPLQQLAHVGRKVNQTAYSKAHDLAERGDVSLVAVDRELLLAQAV